VHTLILITGANGFVGMSLVKELVRIGLGVRVIVRSKSSIIPSNVEQIVLDLEDLVIDSPSVKLKSLIEYCFKDIEICIHLAAIAHKIDEIDPEINKRYRLINTDVTLLLAEYAESMDVKRFIFLSSIKVNGESTISKFSALLNDNWQEEPEFFSPIIGFTPKDPYAISKYNAEIGLLDIAKRSNIDVVIIRSPLIYGKGAKGNLEKLSTLLKLSIPLPFGSIDNKRSLIAIDNLIDFILLCTDIHKTEKAANEIFIVSDQDDISTTELLSNLSKAMETGTSLFRFPVYWLIYLFRAIGKKDQASKLFGNLRLDAKKANILTGWKPRVNMKTALERMVNDNDK
jgi:nucleoside-diphosphate-sugar epimerase